uniref:Uncharacterized protein n=1 Tax=Rhizophora mucronata TaxID=61149 RepID=A0A2P2PDL5_RHIMU
MPSQSLPDKNIIVALTWMKMISHPSQEMNGEA